MTPDVDVLVYHFDGGASVAGYGESFEEDLAALVAHSITDDGRAEIAREEDDRIPAGRAARLPNRVGQ